MKYEIKVTEIHEDGTRKPFFFDTENTVSQLEVGGFVILGSTETDDSHVQSTCAIHDIAVPEIACCIDGNIPLMEAAASAMLKKLSDRVLHGGPEGDCNAAK